ncbi:serine hydrolase [Mesoterricola silvestris]|uniref:Beta-lactamase-related domain-containing protein n=1 Tax=Mesoterricola silvestris TaxID=2927979 RepID=A0AA48K9M2_9BACT|nr:serine hydrolase [Mesoterricola silvestris]BDU74134.1 hypothetical protein METEAL_33080 [Mesoterricola silvestris]
MRIPPLSVAGLLLCLPASAQAGGLSDPDPAARWKAVVALAAQGAGALPEALRVLETGDAPGREAAARVLGRLGPAADAAVPALVRALKDPEARVRERAAQALGALGPGAAPAAPALAEVLADPDVFVQGQAAAALGCLGPGAVPVLARALEAKEAAARKGAATALGRLGSAAAPAAPGLVKALGAAEGAERQGAAFALGAAGAGAPALREALADPDEDVRWAAAWALDRMGAAPGGTLDTIRTLTPRLMKELKVPGVSIAVIRDRKIAWTGTFGVADALAGTPVARDTVFEACSMSKPVFAYLALLLADRGVLDLDRPLCAYLPGEGYPPQAEFRLITARHVLSHTSGLPNWRKDGEEREGPVAVAFQPGSRFLYSGEGMYLLQRVVERIADEPLELLAERLVFKPLGMGHSSFAWTPAVEAGLAAGHGLDGSFKARSRYLHANAAYTLYTTGEDYARFLLAFLDPAVGGLKAETLKAALTAQVKLDAREPMERPGAARGLGVGWCLGWSVNATRGGAIYHHSGANQTGFRCFSQFDPARGTGLVILTNALSGTDLWVRLVNRVGDL